MPTAYSSDPVAAAKICVEFANANDKLTIIGGALGEQVLDVEGVKALAKLPSLDELRGKLVGLLQAPAVKLAGVTQTCLQRVPYCAGMISWRQVAGCTHTLLVRVS